MAFAGDFGVLDERADRASKIQRAIEDALEEMDREQEVMAPLRAYTSDELIGASGLSRPQDQAEASGDRRGRARRHCVPGSAPAYGEPRPLQRSLTALLAGERWRGTLTRMELLLRSLGTCHEECRGREHLALARAADGGTALPFATALGPVYFTRDGKPVKKAYIAKKYFTGTDRKSYEDAFFAVQDLLVRFRDLHARLLAGRESLWPAHLVPAGRGALPGAEAPGRSARFR